MSDSKYIIGIDLGTTHSIVAYTEINVEQGRSPAIRLFEIPQIVSPHTIEKRPSLASFLYLPPAAEAREGVFDLPWMQGKTIVVGEYARIRGAEVPQRVIASSKSWLCNTSVDRNSPILPWEAPADVEKMSPVQAASAILEYIRSAWDYEMAAADPSLTMEKQVLYLTVPASFDAVARELTVQAAEQAGLSGITLLEEPQAAFYSWIDKSDDTWRESVRTGDRILICDVGGGTTDFSLIRISEEDGSLVLERTAVGDHLLVGGDNMDLTLAYHLNKKLADAGTRIDSWQMRGLIHGCRSAKETLFSEPDEQTYPITILGRGSGLIGGAVKTTLSTTELDDTLMNGFFPECDADAEPVKPRRAGLQEAGLLYASDPGITRHMAAFLRRGARDGEGRMTTPTAVLFNGGVMKAPRIRERIKDVLDSWNRNDAGAQPVIREINTDDYDLAVARGAAYYGHARLGHGIRIRGGLGKSYYIGIAAAMPAVPGMPAPVKALCVASFGMEEGTRTILDEKEFVLVVGEQVRFDFFGSSTRKNDPAGAIIEDWHEEIEEITTLETMLDGPAGTSIRVYLDVHATEIGTLEIWCVSVADQNRWKLEFNVREQTRS